MLGEESTFERVHVTSHQHFINGKSRIMSKLKEKGGKVE